MTATSDLPEIAPQDALPEITVAQLPEASRAGATRAGWSSLMPVQARAIPYLLAGRDMIIQARTGSGKTGAFLLPMLTRLDPRLPTTQALILVPTRELARQVWEESERLAGDMGLRAVAVYGGVGYGPQLEALRRGAHIVVGTPGRVLDHLLRGTLDLSQMSSLVFDEADRMLSMGFYPDMKQVQRYLPKHKIHRCMFSATFPPYVLRTAREFIPQPEFVTLSDDHVHVTDTEHAFYTVRGIDKGRALVRLIEIENPAAAIIFCNTKANVHYVSVVLQRFGYDADELSADRSQSDRERVLQRVRQGRLRFLVATDVAARGIDIPELPYVIQYEPPEDPEGYVHRAGRTGRAGATGVALSLVTLVEKMNLTRIARRYAIPIQERPLPTEEDVEAVVTERLTALLEQRLRARDKLATERAQRFLPLARSLADNDDELAIVAMLLDDYYQQMLHTPLPQPGDEPPAAAPAPASAPRSDAPAGEEGEAQKKRRRRRPRRSGGAE